MFTFMEIFKKNKRIHGGGELKQNELLTIKQTETDVFLEIFKDDFNILSEPITNKVRVK